MNTFKTFLLEQEADQQAEIQKKAQELEAKVKELSRPEAVQQTLQQIMQQSGAKSEDELIRYLENHPQVRKVMQAYQQAKTKSNESVSLDEGLLDMFAGIGRALKGIFMWAVKSVAKTVGFVLGSMFVHSSPLAKANYIAMLLLTFGLAPYLAVAGAPAAVYASEFVVGYTATWWGLMWFGRNILDPFLKMTGA